MGDILKRSNFFRGEIKNVVLTCLRLETRSNLHYFWSFIMHSKSSSNFFCCPGALLLHFILREHDILFIWVIHPWRNFWKEAIFSQLRPKLVLFCLRLETGSNIYYSWNFTMHSIISSNCVLLPWCSSTPFYPERARSPVHLSDSSKGDILKRSKFFHRWDQKHGFNLSTLRNTFQHLVLLKFHHALNFFSKFLLLPWCTATPFYSKRASYFFHLKVSSMKDILKRSNFFIDETENVVLTCIRSETRSNIHYSWNFTMHSVSSSICVLLPWCNCTPFYSLREQDFLFISLKHPRGLF